MARVLSSEVGSHVGERVTLQGWLVQVRQLSRVSFLILRDRGGTAQVVLQDGADRELVSSLHRESVLEVAGLVRPRGDGREGVELVDATVAPISPAAAAPPFDLFRPALDLPLPTLLDNAPLALRHPSRAAVFEIQAAAVHGFRAELRRQGFVEVHTPKIVAAATEGGANVFPVAYFDRTAYLAQSPQFYKQTMVGVFERVFEVGPVFRAEPHDTPRHLNEYVSLDAEMGFIRDHRDVMAVLSAVIAAMLRAVAEDAGAALERLGVALPEVPDPIPVVHFVEAQRLLGHPDPAGGDLTAADEAALGDWARRTHGADFLFVEGYPAAQRPFYTHPDPARPGFTRGFDLLFRGQELVTGGQRLHRHQDYLDALALRGLSPAAFAGYLQAFLYGMPPHGGFAIGLERFVARIAGLENIRLAALFPRDQARLAP